MNTKRINRQFVIGGGLRLAQDKLYLVMLLLLTGIMTGYAQSNCFMYEDEGKTIITDLTETGQVATSLTIPATVTAIRSEAFEMASNLLTGLYVENGGNPTFEPRLFGENANTLTMIEMGDNMSVANMIALLQSVGTFKEGTTISAYGFSGDSDATDDTWDAVNWENVSSVMLPAELVAPTSYGTATVSGRFNINKEIISFCTSATFRDTDNGSNMLFYRADRIADDGRLHIQRVDYVVGGEGVLIHRTESSQGYCDLERYSGTVSYPSNMLVGVTEPTAIESTDGSYTNYILKDGAFHPTSGGTVKANKAYLQIPTNAAREGALTIDFGDEVTGLSSIHNSECNSELCSPEHLRSARMHNDIYDLSGRRITNDQMPTAKGLYINNGKKYFIR